MARIEIKCFEKDKKRIIECDFCPFSEDNLMCDDYENCSDCLKDNIEFVIKECI